MASSALGVRGVPLLPEELGRAQEQPWPQFPAHHVGPLIQQQRQVPVRADPAGHHLADDRLRGRPDDQRLFQLLAARVRDHRQLGREALDVLRLAAQVAFRDEQREVGVDVPGVLDPLVQVGLQQFPDPVAVRPDYHRAPGRAAVYQLGLDDQLVVPGREILTLRSHAMLIPCHAGQVRPARTARPTEFRSARRRETAGTGHGGINRRVP